MTDKTLQLRPQSMVVFKADGLTGPQKDHLEISFGNGGKVALHIPMARKGEKYPRPGQRPACTP